MKRFPNKRAGFRGAIVESVTREWTPKDGVKRSWTVGQRIALIHEGGWRRSLSFLCTSPDLLFPAKAPTWATISKEAWTLDVGSDQLVGALEPQAVHFVPMRDATWQALESPAAAAIHDGGFSPSLHRPDTPGSAEGRTLLLPQLCQRAVG